MHGLLMHMYNSDLANLVVDHLGLHKALCILMGWNYRTPPDNSKVYQFLSAEEAAANLDDLIIWPPLVIIQNTITGKSREGRMEGLGNRAMDNYLRGILCLPFFIFAPCQVEAFSARISLLFLIHVFSSLFVCESRTFFLFIFICFCHGLVVV